MDPIELLQSQIAELQGRLFALETDKAIIEHDHNGFGTTRILWDSISTKKFYIFHTIYGADAATAANYSSFFIAPVPCVVTGFKEVHATAGTDGSAVTIDLQKLTGTTAPGSGTTLLNATLSLKATINSVQAAVMTLTNSTKSLAVNDRIALKSSGTLTAVANVSVIVELTVI